MSRPRNPDQKAGTLAMTLPIPVAALSQHIIVLGKTRAGKSSKARVIVEHLLRQVKPVCIVDPKGDWYGLRSSADGKSSGFPVVIFGGDHADYPINEHSGAIVAELIASGNRPAIIDLGGWMVGPRTRFFIAFAEAFFRHSRGQRWLVIDEVHNFAPQSQGKVADVDTGKMLHWANRLASEGSGKGINLISASQRPQKVHKDYVTSHETLIACRAVHPLDLGAMEDWMKGYDPTRAKEVRASLPKMQRPDGWVWSPEIDFGPKQITWPLFATYDSFAAPTGHTARKLKGWAAIDESTISARLAKVTEEAKANDPKALKAEIADLKRQLAARPAETKTVTVTDKAALENAEKKGFERGKKEVAAAADRQVRESRLAYLTILRGILSPISENLDDLLKMAKADKAKIAAAVVFTPTPAVTRNTGSPASTGSRPGPVRVAASAPPRNPSPAAGGDGEERPLKAERKPLAVLASVYPAGMTEAQWAVAAGLKRSGGTWGTYLSRLRMAGRITAQGDLFFATEQGIADLGGDVPMLPPPGPQLVDFWAGKITGASKMLRCLAGQYPAFVTRDALAAALDLTGSGGTFGTYLSRLRTPGLIEERGDELRAAPSLME
jgi:uncharacterized protein DUF87